MPRRKCDFRPCETYGVATGQGMSTAHTVEFSWGRRKVEVKQKGKKVRIPRNGKQGEYQMNHGGRWRGSGLGETTDDEF